MTVDNTPTRSEADWIVSQLQTRFEAGDADGFFFKMICSAGGALVANGKFAIGKIGAARTGLSDGERELRMIDRVICPQAGQ